MRVFRIVKKRRAADAFSGEGARLYGGRWNLPGTPMVYCAETRALAALESLGHFQGAERRIPFVIFAVDVPDGDVRTLALERMPPGWASREPVQATQEAGSAWQHAAGSVALRVPSVHVPREWCVLLNPEHPRTRGVVVHYPEDYAFDERL